MSKFWNDEKFQGISSFYTCVPKVQSYDRIFGHFGPFFALLTPYPCILLQYQDRIRALFEIATAFGHTIILRLRSNTLVSCMNQVLQTNNVATRWYLPLSLFNLNDFLQFRVIDVFFFSYSFLHYDQTPKKVLQPLSWWISSETMSNINWDLKPSNVFYLRLLWEKGLFQVQIIIFFWKIFTFTDP